MFISSTRILAICVGASSYEPANGAGSVRGRLLLSVHMANFSPVDQDEIQKTQTKTAWWTLVTLLIKLIHILLK